jgi:hypothetical protein
MDDRAAAISTETEGFVFIIISQVGVFSAHGSTGSPTLDRQRSSLCMTPKVIFS